MGGSACRFLQDQRGQRGEVGSESLTKNNDKDNNSFGHGDFKVVDHKSGEMPKRI